MYACARDETTSKLLSAGSRHRRVEIRGVVLLDEVVATDALAPLHGDAERVLIDMLYTDESRFVRAAQKLSRPW